MASSPTIPSPPCSLPPHWLRISTAPPLTRSANHCPPVTQKSTPTPSLSGKILLVHVAFLALPARLFRILPSQTSASTPRLGVADSTPFANLTCPGRRGRRRVGTRPYPPHRDWTAVNNIKGNGANWPAPFPEKPGRNVRVNLDCTKWRVFVGGFQVAAGGKDEEKKAWRVCEA